MAHASSRGIVLLLAASGVAGCGTGGGSDGGPDGPALVSPASCVTDTFCAKDPGVTPCVSGYDCDLAYAPPRCVRLYCSAAGSACSADIQCGQGLRCSLGTCRGKAGRGEACGTNPCVAGLVCQDGRCIEDPMAAIIGEWRWAKAETSPVPDATPCPTTLTAPLTIGRRDDGALVGMFGAQLPCPFPLIDPMVPNATASTPRFVTPPGATCDSFDGVPADVQVHVALGLEQPTSSTARVLLVVDYHSGSRASCDLYQNGVLAR